MKQEDRNKPITLWKFFRQSHIYYLIPLILARVLFMQAPVGIIEEKYENSLGMFLVGITCLLFWIQYNREVPTQEDKKNPYWWGFVAYKFIFLMLTIVFWIRAITSFLELF
jgi:hypothetical protein